MTARVSKAPHRAISTRYAGPTDHRGSRVLATVLGSGKRFSFTWDDALGSLENHDAAAIQACAKMAWSGELLGASVNGGGYIYILRNARHD